MLLNSKLINKDDQIIKFRFNSNTNKNSFSKGNDFNKYGAFDYQATLLSKKRKLENDLKNGNMNNFNKVLNIAVINSSRNNDNELIPNKIEFKLSHVLKGEEKIERRNISNLVDSKYNNSKNIKNNLKSLICDSYIINDYRKISVFNCFDKPNSAESDVINNKLKGVNAKGFDSDTSDLTKTSSVEVINLNNIDINNALKKKEIIQLKPALTSITPNSNNLNNKEIYQLRNITNKASEFRSSNPTLYQNKSASRKNSYISNSSDKPSKSVKNHVFHDNYVDSLLEWKKPYHVGSGLNNMGNTCFINSVLQSLLYTPGLINYFVFSEHRKKCNPKGLCLMCEFHCLIELSKANKLASLTPKNILNNLKFISKNIKIGRQEDAHEFLLYLLDGFEKACKNYVGSIKNNFIVSSNFNDDNLIQKLFGAKLASCVICLKCKNVSKKIDQYLNLSIVN